MKKIAIFPGSFDPITIGHVDIVQRALPLFDQVIIAIGTNSQKKYLFSLAERLALINECFKNEEKVITDTFKGLTADYANEKKSSYLLRGVRTSPDFEFEKTIAQLNKSLSPQLETILLVSQPQYSHVSSTIVREIIVHGGDVSPFVPAAIVAAIKAKQ